MNISKMTMAIALAGATLVASAEEEKVYDDAEVSQRFIYSTGFFCGNGNPAGGELKWILETCCRNDTNRYVRIAKETALTNEVFKPKAVRIVRQYGSAADVPFLYSCTNYAKCAWNALKGILQLEGLTESSIAATSAYLACTNTVYADEKGIVAVSLFECAVESSATSELKALASSNALAFASRNLDHARYNDMGFCRVDPTYKYSRRRLLVLRTLWPACYGYEILENYVTNAINELVAYPEANLPD